MKTFWVVLTCVGLASSLAFAGDCGGCGGKGKEEEKGKDATKSSLAVTR